MYIKVYINYCFKGNKLQVLKSNTIQCLTLFDLATCMFKTLFIPIYSGRHLGQSISSQQCLKMQ